MQNKQKVTSNLSGDLQFLIACCQVEQSDVDTDFILNYLSEKDEEQLHNLISLSTRHGILPLVYKAIKKISLHNDTAIPQDFLAQLKAHYMGISQRNMLMSAELIRIIKLLRENSIKAIAFKGPALSQMAYGDITLRQYVDLDILVDEEKLYDAALLLTNHHYIPRIPLAETLSETFLSLGHDYALFNKKNNVTVELHWTLMRKNHILNLNTFNLWEKSKSVKINQNNIKTFYIEFLLVYLCVHATKHLWARIEWITDIDRLIQNNSLNWDKVLDLAETLEHLKTLYLGLSLSNTLFQTEIPSKLNNELQIPPIVKSHQLILDLLNSDFISHQEGISAQMKKYKLFRLLKDKSTLKIFVFFDIIFDFSAYDYKTLVKLPNKLTFLYLILRPAHLMNKNIKRYWNK